jgi:hypothetical protein
MNMDDIFSQFGDIFGSAWWWWIWRRREVNAELKEATYELK